MQILILENLKNTLERRSLLLDSLRSYLNNPRLTVVYDKNGKPFLNGSPLFISVTTTERVMLCVISETPVGVDGEELERFDRDDKIQDYIAIAKRFFTQSEVEYIKKDPKKRFPEVWVRKEAYVKLTGKGVSDFPNFSVSDGETLFDFVNNAKITWLKPDFEGSDSFIFATAIK